MVTRRDVCLLGALAPWLTACGGGSNGSNVIDKPEIDREQVIRTTIAPDDWPMAAPASQGIADTAMQTFLVDAATIPQMRSLLVVRNAQLIGERYYADALSSDLRHVRSATKTVSSLLIGLAIRDGKISGVNATLASLLPKELAQLPNSVAGTITLEQILQMRTGQAWDDDAHIPSMFTEPNLASLALSLPISGLNPPAWNYNSASSHLPSPILAHAYGLSELEVATRNLFEPLGIKQVAWSHDATGNNHGSFGLQMRTRDFLKLAWLALDGGQWQGHSVVPASWIASSLTSSANLSAFGSLTKIGYGYLWWTGTLGGHAISLAWGFGGQLAILVPDLRIAIATAMQWNIPLAQGEDSTNKLLSVIARFLQTLK
ncbi:serine hydrolase domain-containing protein [Undibacterium flavidum]|uniref:Serine hydrolase n=1 Tax=Undibacterium flavidum TaxID=2762297 RepID=A0ABR6YC09_9BURK|nr:serine hydrolase [Undibacterium flavidum]MBC3874057.1 serine hydrolase [Undibacterium flavidum]